MSRPTPGTAPATCTTATVHALASLADDAPTRALRQTCVDVLCAYFCLPYTAKTDLPTGDTEARHAYRASREVRRTVIRMIRDHLRLPAEEPHSWRGHDFDFTEVTFDGGDFSGAVFSGGKISFRRATLSGDTIDFDRAVFSGGDVSFMLTTFPGVDIDFGGAVFSAGTVSFSHATFSGGSVYLDGAVFSGGTLSFSGSTFSGGTVDFDDADGDAPPSGLVTLAGDPLPPGLRLPSSWLTSSP